MKTIFLIRHAKSSRDDVTLADRERPLEARGERDAAKMGRRLAKRRVKPDLIVSSPAVRALQTARIIAQGLDHRPERIRVDDRLYAATADGLIALIEQLDDRLDCVMLAGHNPEFTVLAHRLCSDITHMPTCAVAEFSFDASTWVGIGRTMLLKTALDTPNNAS